MHKGRKKERKKEWNVSGKGRGKERKGELWQGSPPEDWSGAQRGAGGFSTSWLPPAPAAGQGKGLAAPRPASSHWLLCRPRGRGGSPCLEPSRAAAGLRALLGRRGVSGGGRTPGFLQRGLCGWDGWTVVLQRGRVSAPRALQSPSSAPAAAAPPPLVAASLQATRALMVVSIVLGVIAMGIASMGMKCTRCGGDDKTKKARIAMTGGIVFIVGGLASLIACSWYGHQIVTDFYSPIVPMNAKYEFGSAIFIGWAGAALVLLGGGLLSCSCPGKSAMGRSYPQGKPISKPPSNREYV